MSGEERRQHPRIAAKIEVRFKRANDAARALRAYSLNLSIGGLCLRTQKAYALGEELSLSVTVAGQKHDLKGVVAWVRPKVAVGVRFVALTPTDREQLERLVNSLQRED